MWELDCEESWALNYWCFWTVVLKTLESPLDCKEIQPVHSTGDQLWDFFGGNDAKAETPVLWPPHAKGWLIGKYCDAGRDWGQEKKGITEDEMAGWHHRLDGRGFGWNSGVGDGQGGLTCCSSWGRKESDMTERLNWTELSSLRWSPMISTLKKYRLVIRTSESSPYYPSLLLTCGLKPFHTLFLPCGTWHQEGCILAECWNLLNWKTWLLIRDAFWERSWSKEGKLWRL